jgi:RimJ/RimL family protein N-acetyltransferase
LNYQDQSLKGFENQPDDGVDSGDNQQDINDLSVESAIGVVGLNIPQLYGHPLPAELAPPAREDLLRMELGYMFLPNDWGRGFAAEAASAVLESFKDNTSWWARDERDGSPVKKQLWVHSVIGVRNPRSIRVAEKIGLQKMGVQAWEGEKVFLGGDWQECKVLICGKMLV